MGHVTGLPKDQPLCVGDLSQLFGVTTRAIRFYEEKGLIRSVRDGANRRWFDSKDRRKLQFIALMRKAGLTISEIRSIIQEGDKDGGLRDYLDLAVTRLSARLDLLDRERTEVAAVLASITEGASTSPLHQT